MIIKFYLEKVVGGLHIDFEGRQDNILKYEINGQENQLNLENIYNKKFLIMPEKSLKAG